VLARDLLACVFGALDARALACAACVCAAWRAEATHDALWSPLYAAVFGPAAGTAGAAPARGLLSWHSAFALAATATPAAVAPATNRVACTRCGVLLWRPHAEVGHADAARRVGRASAARRTHVLMPVAPDAAAQRTLRALALLPPRSDDASDSDGARACALASRDIYLRCGNDLISCVRLLCACCAAQARQSMPAAARRTGCGLCRAAWRRCRSLDLPSITAGRCSRHRAR
jgi:hypothetical protein